MAEEYVERLLDAAAEWFRMNQEGSTSQQGLATIVEAMLYNNHTQAILISRGTNGQMILNSWRASREDETAAEWRFQGQSDEAFARAVGSVQAIKADMERAREDREDALFERQVVALEDGATALQMIVRLLGAQEARP